MVDFIEVERGYRKFYRELIRVLRAKDVEAFTRHIAQHPREAGRFSHVLGLSRELAEIEMYKAILRFQNLRDLHRDALDYLNTKGLSGIQRKYGKRGSKKGKGKGNSTL